MGALPVGCRRIVLQWAHTLGSSLFHIPDPYEDMARLASVCPPAMVLDVGAHVGETVRELVKRFPGVPVHAFEPTPNSYNSLRTIARSLSNVSVHEVAVSDHCGRMKLFLNANSQTNSLLDNDADNKADLAASTQHIGSVDVELTTLDKWATKFSLQGPIFIKADVQGAEMQILEGGRHTFRNRVMAFYSEVSIGRLYANQADLFSLHHALTEDYPFVLYQIYRTRSNPHGRALWTDALWIHRELLSLLERQTPI